MHAQELTLYARRTATNADTASGLRADVVAISFGQSGILKAFNGFVQRYVDVGEEELAAEARRVTDKIFGRLHKVPWGLLSFRLCNPSDHLLALVEQHDVLACLPACYAGIAGMVDYPPHGLSGLYSTGGAPHCTARRAHGLRRRGPCMAMPPAVSR